MNIVHTLSLPFFSANFDTQVTCDTPLYHNFVKTFFKSAHFFVEMVFECAHFHLSSPNFYEL